MLDAVIDLTLERHRDQLGAVLVDERDHGTTPRVLFSIEHALQDAGVTRAGNRHVVSNGPSAPGSAGTWSRRRRRTPSPTAAAVKDRLTKEISYWDHRAAQLTLEEGTGKTGARLNSGEARRRADTLQRRLQKRLEEQKRDAQISPRPPVVLGGLLVVPQGLVDRMLASSRK